VDLCIQVARLLAPHYVTIFAQMRKTFANEFDYRREASLQREAYTRLRNTREVVVPQPFDENHPICSSTGQCLVTKNVFVMERLWGKPIDKWASEQVQEMATRKGIPVEQLLRQMQAMSAEEVQLLLPSELTMWACGLAKNGATKIRNSLAVLHNWTLGWFGSSITIKKAHRAVNVYQVVKELFDLQAKCIFEEGFLNCDPHAGNILLLEDGRLGLIDWGQVARLSEAQQQAFAKSVIAVAARDEPLVAELAVNTGLRTEKNCSWVIMKLVTFWLGSFGEDVVGELGGVTMFEQTLARIDRLVETSDEYFPPVRCILMTRGVAALMGFPCTDSSVRMRPAAEACLARGGVIDFQVSPGRKLPRPEIAERVLTRL